MPNNMLVGSRKLKRIRYLSLCHFYSRALGATSTEPPTPVSFNYVHLRLLPSVPEPRKCGYKDSLLTKKLCAHSMQKKLKIWLLES